MCHPQSKSSLPSAAHTCARWGVNQIFIAIGWGLWYSSVLSCHRRPPRPEPSGVCPLNLQLVPPITQNPTGSQRLESLLMEPVCKSASWRTAQSGGRGRGDMEGQERYPVSIPFSKPDLGTPSHFHTKPCSWISNSFPFLLYVFLRK